MNIIGINGAYRTEVKGNPLFPFPTHTDFKLIEFEERDKHNADVYVQTNVLGHMKHKPKDRMKDMYNYIKEQNKPIIVFEQATFRKNLDMANDLDNYYFRVGLNHYTFNEGIFKNENSSKDRWNQIQKEQNIEIKPWKTNGDYILFLLQNPIDTSLNDIVVNPDDYEKWVQRAIIEISHHTDRDIKIRLHPKFAHKTNTTFFENLEIKNKVYFSDNIKETTMSSSKDIYKDFEDAKAVVSFSSNGLIESVCEGVPTIALSPTSFARPVSYHNLKILREKDLKCDFDRTQWLYDCAYTQWKMSEINEGTVHRRLLDVS